MQAQAAASTTSQRVEAWDEPGTKWAWRGGAH
jgi:hypothetical protein